MGRYVLGILHKEAGLAVTLFDRHHTIHPDTWQFSLSQARGLLKALRAAVDFMEQPSSPEWEIED